VPAGPGCTLGGITSALHRPRRKVPERWYVLDVVVAVVVVVVMLLLSVMVLFVLVTVLCVLLVMVLFASLSDLWIWCL